MARIIKITKDDSGAIVHYRIGGDTRIAYLSNEEMAGLSLAEIRILAQQKADSDLGQAGPGNEREDVVANPVKEARAWFRDHPVAIAFLENTPDEIDSAIEGMTLAQLKQVVKGAAIIARTLALLEIAE